LSCTRSRGKGGRHEGLTAGYSAARIFSYPWGALLLFLKPTKHVRLELLTATASSSLMNTERLLVSNGSTARGVYLPSKLFHDYQSSLVYVPAQMGEPLRNAKKSPSRTRSPHFKRSLSYAPGPGLVKTIREAHGKIFHRDHSSRAARIASQTVRRAGDNQEHAHPARPRQNEGRNEKPHLQRPTRRKGQTIPDNRNSGQPLSSAIACALAKATGKPVTILQEETTQDQTTTIQYIMHEE